jgi:IS30 family transposase
MSDRGQPRALDDEKQKTVCSLVAAGASLRQAAHFVDCDPKTIRREVKRNDDFRCQLAKARSEANIHPLQTLQQAAKTNWRAALSWMERLDPDRFARHDAKLITQREANQFALDLVESIERAVSSAKERNTLFDLLTPAMPAAMRRRWNSRAMRRAVERSAQIFEHRKAERESKRCWQKAQRDLRRRDLWHEIGQWLPSELYQKLAQNESL